LDDAESDLNSGGYETDGERLTPRRLLGDRLKSLRKQRRWTLSDVSERTGLAVSTISKVERGLMSLTYDKFSRLATGLDLDIGELFSPGRTAFQPGTVALARRDTWRRYETENYVYDMLFSDLRHKKMTPMLGLLKAREKRAFADYVSHPGEEFLMVLSGRITVHFEAREPVTLEPMDSLYFDSANGHIYLSSGDEPARILVVCTDIAEDAREDRR
jgi:transcriptional regulator with XRE-family HTH domain